MRQREERVTTQAGLARDHQAKIVLAFALCVCGVAHGMSATSWETRVGTLKTAPIFGFSACAFCIPPRFESDGTQAGLWHICHSASVLICIHIRTEVD